MHWWELENSQAPTPLWRSFSVDVRSAECGRLTTVTQPVATVNCIGEEQRPTIFFADNRHWVGYEAVTVRVEAWSAVPGDIAFREMRPGVFG